MLLPEHECLPQLFFDVATRGCNYRTATSSSHLKHLTLFFLAANCRQMISTKYLTVTLTLDWWSKMCLGGGTVSTAVLRKGGKKFSSSLRG